MSKAIGKSLKISHTTPTTATATSRRTSEPTKSANLSETVLPKDGDLLAQLYKSVRFFLIISELLVCAPMGAHRLEVAGSRLKVVLRISHLLWCIFIYIVLFTCAYTQYTQSNSDLPTVQKPLYFCEYLVYLIHILQIIVSISYAGHKFRAFPQTIVNFDLTLLDFKVPPKYNSINRFLNGHLLLILFHFLITSIIDYFYSGCNPMGFLRSTTVYMLPNIILEISLIQYYGLLYTICERSIDLNHLLQMQLQQRPMEPSLLRENLQKIRLLYSQLELFTANVNDAFAQSVVLVYIGSFVNITLNIFLVYKYLNDFANADWSWILYSVIWTFMHIGKMFFILYYNHGVQNQKNITALLLNDMTGQNAEMEETLTHFILQLILNTRSNVVCGVAALNMDFITSLLVAISTLFIFLIQYDITFEALTKTHKTMNKYGVP